MRLLLAAESTIMHLTRISTC